MNMFVGPQIDWWEDSGRAFPTTDDAASRTHLRRHEVEWIGNHSSPCVVISPHVAVCFEPRHDTARISPRIARGGSLL
jgi:hypothetical protein